MKKKHLKITIYIYIYNYKYNLYIARVNTSKKKQKTKSELIGERENMLLKEQCLVVRKGGWLNWFDICLAGPPGRCPGDHLAGRSFDEKIDSRGRQR